MRHVLAVMLASYFFGNFMAEAESDTRETPRMLPRTAVWYMSLLHIVLGNNLQSGEIGVK
jgi:hypothetical protein